MLKSLLRLPFVLRARYRDRHLAPDAVDLAAVAIFREEAPFLDEWLTFHEAVGIRHFYLYNNFSTDHFHDVLTPWIKRGLVTLTDWPVEVGQLPAYRHCIENWGQHAHWMAFIDIDEFLFAPDGKTVSEVLRALSGQPGVMVHSPYFGANGIEQRPPAPIARAFTRRAATRMSAKTIANPRWVYAIRNVHSFNYWRGNAIDPTGKPFDAGKPDLGVLRLNHYWSRSLQDLRDKIARGDASMSQKRDPDWSFAFERELNDIDDTSILPLLDRIFR